MTTTFSSAFVLLRRRLALHLVAERDVRGSLELDPGIRKVSSRARTIRGGGGGWLKDWEDEEGTVGDNDLEVDRDRVAGDAIGDTGGG
jgi:hypothetical protein